jgi:hypothetical protein
MQTLMAMARPTILSHLGGGSINAYINNYHWKSSLLDKDKDDKEGEDDKKEEEDGWKCNLEKTKCGNLPELDGSYKSYSGALRGLQYFTAVNLTPYKFVYFEDGSNSYQMKKRGFGTSCPEHHVRTLCDMIRAALKKSTTRERLTTRSKFRLLHGV